MSDSKPLSHGDESGFAFAQEMLQGDVTATVNFDRLQKDADGYIIMEYLLCEEDQSLKHGTTPFSSHPNRYMHLNRKKFISLWDVAQALRARLYLVNYAKVGTKYSNEIKLMKVTNVNANQVASIDYCFTRSAFSRWFRLANQACLDNGCVIDEPPNEFYYVVDKTGFYHKDTSCVFLRNCAPDQYIRVLRGDDELLKKYHMCMSCMKLNVKEMK